MKALRTSETLANVYQATRRYNPEDNHIHFHNLKDRDRSPRFPVLRDLNRVIHTQVQYFSRLSKLLCGAENINKVFTDSPPFPSNDVFTLVAFFFLCGCRFLQDRINSL
jgi:hypothetical protein